MPFQAAGGPPEADNAQTEPAAPTLVADSIEISPGALSKPVLPSLSVLTHRILQEMHAQITANGKRQQDQAAIDERIRKQELAQQEEAQNVKARLDQQRQSLAQQQSAQQKAEQKARKPPAPESNTLASPGTSALQQTDPAAPRPVEKVIAKQDTQDGASAPAPITPGGDAATQVTATNADAVAPPVLDAQALLSEIKTQLAQSDSNELSSVHRLQLSYQV